MILDMPIPGITPCHILATSSDIQKLIKEDTTTRKLPSASIGSLNTLGEIQETLVAEAFLQEFDVTLYIARHLETL